jgi:hypothetical protein
VFGNLSCTCHLQQHALSWQHIVWDYIVLLIHVWYMVFSNCWVDICHWLLVALHA